MTKLAFLFSSRMNQHRLTSPAVLTILSALLMEGYCLKGLHSHCILVNEYFGKECDISTGSLLFSLNIFYSINTNDIQHTYILNIQRKHKYL